MGGVLRLRCHLVVEILNFEPFVTRVTDVEATVKGVNILFIPVMHANLFLIHSRDQHFLSYWNWIKKTGSKVGRNT